MNFDLTISVELLVRQVKDLSHQVNNLQQNQVNLKRQVNNLQQRSGSDLYFRPFSKIHQEIVFQKNPRGNIHQSYTIKMSDVTTDAKFVLADIFISCSQNDHWTITFSDKNDCSGTLYDSAYSGKPPPNNFDHKSQKAIMMFDASEYGRAYPLWGQWT